MHVNQLLLVVACILFVIAASGWPPANRFNLMAAGLAIWVLAMLVGGVALR